MNNKKLFPLQIFIIVTKSLAKFTIKMYRQLLQRLHFSITFKITTVYALIFLRVLFLMSTIISVGFAAYLIKDAEGNLRKYSQFFSSFVDTTVQLPESSIEQLAQLGNISINIFDTNRNLVYTTNKVSDSVMYYYNHSNSAFAINNNYLIVLNNAPKNGAPLLVLNNTFNLDSNNVLVQFTYKLETEILSFIFLITSLVIINILFLIIIIIKGSISSRKMLLPVEKMTKTVKNITVNALDTRLDVSGSQDELKELAITFNQMLDRIQQAYQQQDQFVSDASHELRTPISVIQGYANLLDRWGKNDKVVLDEAVEAIKAESENMKGLIDKLLFLARSDKGVQKLDKHSFYVNELIDEVFKETKLIDVSHEITCGINECILINADRKLLKEVLRIFIDNSIKYTPTGGKIKLECHTQNSQVVISVQDTGQGISKEDLPYIFNRFYRADKSRTKQTGGTGLGLAIAKWIVTKHKGSIKVESEINVGTKIIIFLPKQS